MGLVETLALRLLKVLFGDVPGVILPKPSIGLRSDVGEVQEYDSE